MYHFFVLFPLPSHLAPSRHSLSLPTPSVHAPPPCTSPALIPYSEPSTSGPNSIQSMQPCCQAAASETDCLANENYTNFYDCRLLNDVGGDCTSLVCDAAVTASPTPSGTATGTEAGEEEVDDADAAAEESGAGRASPLVFGRESAAAAASMLVVATAVSVAAAAAAFV